MRVFVSSTLGELAPERAAARAAIEHMHLAPVMFELGARPHPPRDLYRSYLEQSHVFVGIYWQRYGWIAPGETVSGLEDEYRLAASHPRLIYVKDPAPDRDPRLSELLDRLRVDGDASYRRFETADELRELIQDDLAALLSERFEPDDRRDQGREPAWTHTNLPVPRSRLVGRDVELATVCDLLRARGPGLVTLTGPGGCGKSRLALEVGLELLDRFNDRVFLVGLESISDPAHVIPAIAQTLGISVSPDQDALDALVERFAEVDLLLLLDNFEHVLDAGPSVSTLLESCPRLAVLATSRAPLRIRGERRIAIPPLAVPPGNRADPGSLSEYAAVTLFIERARGVQGDFALTAESAPIVAELCHRLDGLPLAIELAAARLSLMTPADLLARLDHRFEILGAGTRDLPKRQQTLRHTIDWSYELLDEPSRRVFRRLSVFAGGSSLDAAEAVASESADADGETLDRIAALLDDSLLTSSITGSGDMRIGMLETMREYAAEKLAGDEDLDEIRRRHAAWYLQLTELAEPHLVAPDEPTWAARLQQERGNARVALEWAATHDVDVGLRIAAATWRFWEFHGAITEGHGWLERLLAPAGEPSLARARALQAASRFACYVGDYQQACHHIVRAIRIFRRAGDRAGIARALHEFGSILLFAGQVDEARRRLSAALLMNRALGDRAAIANTLTNLGIVALCEADHAGAEAQLREALAIQEAIGDRFGVATVIANLSEVARLDGRHEEAFTATLDSLRMFEELGDSDGMASSFDCFAKLASAGGDYRQAARLFGFAAALREDAGTVPALLEREEMEREIAIARRGAGTSTFDAEWLAGRGMAIEEIVAMLKPPGRVVT